MKRFHLPRSRLSRPTADMVRRSQITVEQKSADERVIENTPSLLALYEFLARPI